jgi:hypothetical protein
VRKNTIRILCVSAAIAAIAACSGGSQNIVGPELFNYTATSEVTSTNPMRFKTTVTIRNPTTDQIDFTFTNCNFPRVLVYANATRTGTPVWDSNTRQVACTLVITTVKLAPGASVSYSQTVTGAEVLGASGSAGTYYVTNEVSLSGVISRVTAGQVSLTR